MNGAYQVTRAVMGTVVSIEVVEPEHLDAHDAAARRVAVHDALDWFDRVEAVCTRFDETSELVCATRTAGPPIPVSATLFEALRFALAVAEETNGAFDPTIGRVMAARGFNREHRTGRVSAAAPADADVTYRDVILDPERRTIAVRRPLTLDLGAVAKGMAIDLVARDLAPLGDFAIDAGGDLYLAGRNREGRPWRVGLRHPRADAVMETLELSDTAVCTSGDYLRRVPGSDSEHHIVDPRTFGSASRLASVTVVAESAMVADALATAAFVLGPDDGRALLEQHGVEGILISPTLIRTATRGLPQHATILPNA